jgi:hypothetical protein
MLVLVTSSRWADWIWLGKGNWSLLFLYIGETILCLNETMVLLSDSPKTILILHWNELSVHLFGFSNIFLCHLHLLVLTKSLPVLVISDLLLGVRCGELVVQSLLSQVDVADCISNLGIWALWLWVLDRSLGKGHTWESFSCFLLCLTNWSQGKSDFLILSKVWCSKILVTTLGKFGIQLSFRFRFSNSQTVLCS